jgi:hypothetical protein
MRFLFSALCVTALTACASDETVAGFAGTDRAWKSAGDTGIVLRFQSGGRVKGSSPCGDFAGEQTAPYPWFDLLVQKMPGSPCDIDVLQLTTMTQSEVSGDTLLLSNDSGISLEFRAVQE